MSVELGNTLTTECEPARLATMWKSSKNTLLSHAQKMVRHEIYKLNLPRNYGNTGLNIDFFVW